MTEEFAPPTPEAAVRLERHRILYKVRARVNALHLPGGWGPFRPGDQETVVTGAMLDTTLDLLESGGIPRDGLRVDVIREVDAFDTDQQREMARAFWQAELADPSPRPDPVASPPTEEGRPDTPEEPGEPGPPPHAGPPEDRPGPPDREPPGRGHP